MRSEIVCILAVLVCMMGCGAQEPKIITAVDRQNMKMIVLAGERTELNNLYDADFIILGGGLGGIAATLAVCSSGRTAILVEETDRIAACFAMQDTSEYFDSNLMDTTGSSKRYRRFRSKIMAWYKERSLKQPESFSPYFSNVEDFGENNFCFGTEAAIDVIYDMLEHQIKLERLTILRRHKIVEVVDYKKRIASLNAVDLDNKVLNQLTGWMFIDATETGDILSLAGIDHEIGRESGADTSEPHAPDVSDSTDAVAYYFYRVIDKNEAPDYYEVDLLEEKPDDTDSYASIGLVKEPRRIKAFARIGEQDISAEYGSGPRARFFVDSIGIGYTPIIIPVEENGKNKLIIGTKPFQIPFRALIAPKYTNFIVAGKSIGTTYIASTAYNNPSVIWAIGEGAGESAGYCASKEINFHKLMNSKTNILSLHKWMVRKRGIPIYWYDDIAAGDPDFVEAQLKPFQSPEYHKSAQTLHFRD